MYSPLLKFWAKPFLFGLSSCAQVLEKKMLIYPLHQIKLLKFKLRIIVCALSTKWSPCLQSQWDRMCRQGRCEIAACFYASSGVHQKLALTVPTCSVLFPEVVPWNSSSEGSSFEIDKHTNILLQDDFWLLNEIITGSYDQRGARNSFHCLLLLFVFKVKPWKEAVDFVVEHKTGQYGVLY